MADYFNAQALNPGTAFKPDGFLGGYMWGEDRQRYNQMAPLQDFMQMMQAQESMNKAQDYTLEAPVRESKREADIATNRSKAGTIGRRDEAEIGQMEVANQYNTATLKDRIKSVALENAVKEGTAGGAKLKQAIQIAQMYAQAAKNGPAAMAAIDQMVQQTGMGNDPMVAVFKSNPQVLGPLMQGLIEADADFQKEMKKIEKQSEANIKLEGVRGANQRALEQERQKKKNLGYGDLLKRAVVEKNDESVLRLYQMMTMDPDIDPKLLEQARAVAEQANRNLRAKDAARQQPGLPGMPSQQPQDRLEQPSAAPSNVVPFDSLK